jgi:hypothetical protein
VKQEIEKLKGEVMAMKEESEHLKKQQADVKQTSLAQ